MTQPLDLGPLLAQASAEDWLSAIKLWRRRRRRDEKLLRDFAMGHIAIAIIGTIISRKAVTANAVTEAGKAFAAICEAAGSPL
jgi:hypothetical protein